MYSCAGKRKHLEGAIYVNFCAYCMSVSVESIKKLNLYAVVEKVVDNFVEKIMSKRRREVNYFVN